MFERVGPRNPAPVLSSGGSSIPPTNKSAFLSLNHIFQLCIHVMFCKYGRMPVFGVKKLTQLQWPPSQLWPVVYRTQVGWRVLLGNRKSRGSLEGCLSFRHQGDDRLMADQSIPVHRRTLRMKRKGIL